MRQGSVFTPVCHSVHRGVSAPVHAGIYPPGQTLAPWSNIPCPMHAGIHPPPPAQCILGYTPRCPVHAGIDMATAVDGTHPTGMHSCTFYLCKEKFTIILAALVFQQVVTNLAK